MSRRSLPVVAAAGLFVLPFVLPSCAVRAAPARVVVRPRPAIARPGPRRSAVVVAPVRVSVGFPPPPPPKVVEVRPAPPSPTFVWRPGGYAWRDGRYVWVPGAWVKAPHAGARWVPGHWRRTPRGGVWVPGHWS